LECWEVLWNRKPGPEKAEVEKSGEKMIEISDFSGKNLSNINLVLQKGEILGISGLAGSGQTELLNTIYKAGKNSFHHKVSVKGSISYVSGDRAKEGVFPLWSILDNMLIANLRQICSGPFLDRKKSETLAQHWYDKLKFKAEGIHSPITSLSGGNQQKALIARGIASGADIILLNDPTAGVDVETKQEIYGLLQEAKKAGKSIVLYSTEDVEMEICDRVYVLHDGMITDELSGPDVTVPNVIKASFKNVGKKEEQKQKKKNAFQSIAGLKNVFADCHHAVDDDREYCREPQSAYVWEHQNAAWVGRASDVCEFRPDVCGRCRRY
jgi:ribose transport system ATP-binding protein